MCSRYSLTSPPQAVRSYFRAGGETTFPARYNIAPTQPALIVRANHNGERDLVLVRWGLIPSWVKDPRDYTTLINARSETAAEKPSFRGPLRHRRCLVPADGFYEWTGPARAKQPHLISAKPGSNTPLLALAGLWEHWLGADGSEIETMAILTVGANRTVSAVHDRMPVIIEPDDFDTWLDCTPGSAEPVMHLLRPAPDTLLDIRPVSTRLNSVRNEGPDLQGEPTSDLGAKLI